ncbi:MAG: chemotaxis protein CheW [Leptolyngbyaceae cyanobacterium RM2_2_4]|nr:chemotaxis protein CheW [Leptolyngbyaceae cyanobacterium SM1_4_3]NJN92453.1 chemotaxis protein CheW [Leptolyngbyaceae cyanobacterium SL_5_14]NJO49651.1 chemotaxis protein CheW [Leptolyngbyaceae cyanobacterium RM2_2_4]NJO76305.1 chemotaxis protein CheW [Leptolyngbyaceae cyanobacterium RM1_406_9]
MTLSLDSLTANPMLSAASLDLLAPELPSPDRRERLLRVYLSLQDSALLPLKHTTEVIRVTGEDILPVPGMPACIPGVCNWRGEMLWLIDLSQLVGFSPLPWRKPGISPFVIVTENDDPVGLLVMQVEEVEMHSLEQLQPPVAGLFLPELMPFVSGILPGSGTPVLDVLAIAQHHFE